MDSSNSNIERDWDCVSEVNSVISMSTFGSVEPLTLHPLLHSSQREVFASYRDALASNMSNQENATFPSTDIIAHAVRPKKSIHERKVETKYASFYRTHDNDQEMQKFMQAQKRRKDRLSQTNLQTRFSDKRSKTKFHRMKRCCARSQTKQHMEEDENIYIPHVNHKSLSWWDCVGDNDLRMARPRWKVWNKNCKISTIL